MYVYRYIAHVHSHTHNTDAHTCVRVQMLTPKINICMHACMRTYLHTFTTHAHIHTYTYTHTQDTAMITAQRDALSKLTKELIMQLARARHEQLATLKVS
jgi:hypothetical protein